MLNMASRMGIKWKASVADKLGIIKKVDTEPHVTQMKLAEELGIPVLTLNNIIVNKHSILHQGGSSKLSRRSLKLPNMRSLKQYH
jgi:hypothetical protein